MAGYTPAFSSIYDGTLYGKWPTATVWASLLPLIDARGEIRLSYEAIAGRTGWPMDLLRKGIDDLMQPDPGSQSPDEDGRRLVLLDPKIPWGWRAVNVKKYRRLASGKDQIADGRNAEKVRKYKERHRETPPDTAKHQGDTHSDSDSDSDSDKKEKTPRRAARGTPQGAGEVSLHESLPKQEWEEWLSHRRKRRWPLDAVTLGKQLKVLVSFDTESQRSIINNSINAGWQGLFAPKAGTARKKSRDAPTTEELEAREAARAGH